LPPDLDAPDKLIAGAARAAADEAGAEALEEAALLWDLARGRFGVLHWIVRRREGRRTRWW